MSDFAKSLKRILAYEGGNVDDPHDPGGRTSRGMTQSRCDAYCDKHKISRFDVWKASDALIAAIYKETLWDRISGDTLPEGVALCIFDAAVNSGLGQAAKWVQRSLNIRANGDFGPLTVSAVINCKDKTKLIRDICARRLAMMQSLPTWKRFGKGWAARVRDIQVTAITWLNEPGVSAIDTSRIQPTPKAPIEAKAAPMNQTAPNATIAVGGLGTVIASLSSVFSDTADKLSPLVATWPRIAEICAVLTVLSVFAGLFISFRKRQHESVIDGSATAYVEERANV